MSATILLFNQMMKRNRIAGIPPDPFDGGCVFIIIVVLILVILFFSAGWKDY